MPVAQHPFVVGGQVNGVAHGVFGFPVHMVGIGSCRGIIIIVELIGRHGPRIRSRHLFAGRVNIHSGSVGVVARYGTAPGVTGCKTVTRSIDNIFLIGMGVIEFNIPVFERCQHKSCIEAGIISGAVGRIGRRGFINRITRRLAVILVYPGEGGSPAEHVIPDVCGR